jgi:Short C-terminal domain
MLRRRPVVRTVARTAVIAGTATAVSGRVSRRQEAKFSSQDAPAPAPEAAAPAPAGPSPDAIEQLKELAALKDQGILTDEEFATQKAKILGE